MEGPADIRIGILSRPELLAAVRQAVESWCLLAGAEDAPRCRVGLAVDEALTNIIRHGYDGRDDGVIELEFRRRGSTVEFVIQDQARQVPIKQIRGRDLDDVKPGGLGVHLIREVMDKAVWSHGETGGMRLVLQKDMAPQAALMESDNDH